MGVVGEGGVAGGEDEEEAVADVGTETMMIMTATEREMKEERVMEPSMMTARRERVAEMMVIAMSMIEMRGSGREGEEGVAGTTETMVSEKKEEEGEIIVKSGAMSRKKDQRKTGMDTMIEGARAETGMKGTLTKSWCYALTCLYNMVMVQWHHAGQTITVGLEI